MLRSAFEDNDDDDDSSDLLGSRDNLYAITVDQQSRPRTAEGKNKVLLVIAFFSFFLFAVAEMLGGIFGNSLSLVEDASTMLVDAFTYIFNYYAEVKKRGATRRKVLQLEILSPLISVIALVATTGYITYQAAQELFPDPPCQHYMMTGLDCGLENSTVFSSSILNLTTDSWSNCESACENTEGSECKSWQFSNATSTCRLWGPDMCTDIMHADPDSTSGTCENDDEDVSIVAMWAFSGVNLLLDFVNLGTFYQNARRKKRLAKTLQVKDESNANMMSAFTHIAIDTMRSLAVMVAALAAGVFGFPSGKTDAVCAMCVTGITLISTIPLVVVLRNKIGQLWRLPPGDSRHPRLHVPQLTGLEQMDIEIGEL